MSFNELGLAEPLLKAIADAGYDTPTPIQKQAIPAVLQGGDLLAGAQTGTGKTAGFTLPMLHRLMHTPAQRDAKGRAVLGQDGKPIVLFGPKDHVTKEVLEGKYKHLIPAAMMAREKLDALESLRHPALDPKKDFVVMGGGK